MSKQPRELKRYTSYDYKGDHDPILDRMQELMAIEQLSYKKIHELTGLSVSTLHHWFKRKHTKSFKPTMRPMFTSVMAYTRGLGYDLTIVKPQRNVSAYTGIKFNRNVAAKADAAISENTAH